MKSKWYKSKPFIGIASAVGSTALALTIGYNALAGKYDKELDAAKEETSKAKQELQLTTEELEKLKPPVGNLMMLPENSRSDGEYWFSSNDEGDALIVAQARPNGAYRLVTIEDSKWYFGVESNGDMHLCINLDPYSVEDRQAIIAAVRENGYAFTFMENRDGTGSYTLVVGNNTKNSSFETSNSGSVAGSLGIPEDPAKSDVIEDLIAKQEAARARQSHRSGCQGRRHCR